MHVNAYFVPANDACELVGRTTERMGVGFLWGLLGERGLPRRLQ